MILTPSIILRVGLLMLLALVVQAYLLSPVELAGAVIWILPASVVAFGLLGGSMTGAVTGFLLGVFSDALVDAPLGSTALALLLVGYLAGSFRERGGASGVLPAALASAVGTVVANLVIGLLIGILGQLGPLSWEAASELVIQALYGFLVGVPIFLLFRKVLAPGLIDDRTARGRRSRRFDAGRDVSWQGNR